MDGWFRRIADMFFTFRGRLNRRRFWMRMLVLYLVVQILAAVGTQFLPALGLSSSVMLVYSVGMTLLFWLSSASLWVRRFHDRNVSGWWYGLYFLFILAVFGWLIYAVTVSGGDVNAPDMQTAKYLIAAGLMAWLFVTIRFGLRKGTAGPNRYGPDPLGQEPSVPLPGEIHIL